MSKSLITNQKIGSLFLTTDQLELFRGLTGPTGAAGATGPTGPSLPASSLDIPNTLVLRNGNGSFAANDYMVDGSIYLLDSTGTTGNIYKNGTLFMNNYGTQSTFLGVLAGVNSEPASNNTGIGYRALRLNNGNFNTALGANALNNNTTGQVNTAIGESAAASQTTASENTAVGVGTLSLNVTSPANTVIGYFALAGLTGGAGSNIVIGDQAGQNLEIGSDNIYIGADAASADEGNQIRIGSGQTGNFQAGIFGVTTVGGTAVFINGSGQLGTATSTLEKKIDIENMGNESDFIHQLRPVTYHYKELGSNSKLEWGLIAEELNEIRPDLVVRDKDGKMAGIAYHDFIPMLLNEVQKLRKELDELKK